MFTDFLSLTTRKFPPIAIARHSHFYRQLNNTMKKQIWIPSIALSFCLAACDSPKTTKEKMDAGADKVAAGVKEMATAAGEKAEKVKDDTKAAMDKVGEKAKAAAADAKVSMEAAAADAKEKMKAAADSAAKAAEDAKAKVEAGLELK